MSVDQIADAILHVAAILNLMLALNIVWHVDNRDLDRATRSLRTFTRFGTFVTIPALTFHIYAWLT